MTVRNQSKKIKISSKHLKEFVLNGMKKPFTVCLTGGMASGKNYVCRKIESELSDVVSIDLDCTVHTAIKECTSKILKTFEPYAKEKGIVLTSADGELDRRALGALIFSQPSLLKKQESIVYPKVIELTQKFIEEQHKSGKSVIINATVLFKTPELLEQCAKIFFVTAPLFKRLIRSKKRDGIALRQILSRFHAQKGLFKSYKNSGIEIAIIKN